MSAPCHTLGPWSVPHFARRDINCECGYVFGNDDRNGAVATVHYVGPDCPDGDDPPREEAEANARLIAAAPELLEALIAISTNPVLNLGDQCYQVREREGEGWEGPAVKAWSDACTKVTAAIARATGGPAK